MNTRNGIPIETRKVDSQHHRKKESYLKEKFETYNARIGKYVTMLKYESGMAVWSIGPLNQVDYGQALKDGFREVETFEIEKEIFI